MSMIDERGQKLSEYSWVCQRELDFKLQLQASGLGDMYCLKTPPPRRRKESTATIFHSSLPRQPANLSNPYGMHPWTGLTDSSEQGWPE